MTKLKKKPTRIVFGRGNFFCKTCGKQFTFAEKSGVAVLDSMGDVMNVCKFCIKGLNPDDYEHIHNDPVWGSYFVKRSKIGKIFYKLKRRLNLVI